MQTGIIQQFRLWGHDMSKINFDLYRKALESDDAFADALRTAYGKKASDARYKSRHIDVDVIRTKKEKLKADKEWLDEMNRKKNPRGSVADSTAAHELILYATNTDKLYPQKMSIVKNIMRRLANGTYDATKAVRLWQYWTDAAAQLYVKEFGTGRVDTVFTAATRRKAAAEIASIEIERIKNFEYGEIIPKRSRGKNPKKGSYAELKPRKEINFRIYAVDKKTGESKYLSTAINLLSAKIIAKAIAHRYPYSRIAVYKE